MGVQIGQTSAALIARLDSSVVRRRARTDEGQLFEQARKRRAEQEDSFQAGFGEETLSPQGAALKTVSSNLERARDLVPTVEEALEGVREAAAEAAARLEAEQAARQAPETVDAPTISAKPRAEPLARIFAQEKPRTASAGFERRAPATESPAATPQPSGAPRDAVAAQLDLLA